MKQLVLLLCLVHLVVTLHTRRAYFLEKGNSNILRSGEFLVYNGLTDTLAYEIKSSFGSDGRHFEIIASPSKEVVGKLMVKGEKIWREATFEVLDNQTRQWKMGKLIRHFKFWSPHQIDIEWDGPPIKHVIPGYMWYGTLINDRDTIMAEFQSRRLGKHAPLTYDLHVHSDDVPDPVFLFYVASINM
ncbi:unnamed protein product [Rotaria sp. Silwood1]|nr:unnamed protein product [Rotaria sp. Silwood1]